MLRAEWADGYTFTANTVWCEEKYVVFSTVAEFWNAYTNIPFVGLALYSLFRGGAHYMPWRFRICYAMVMIIGVGSYIFHSRLTRSAQLLDELPMLLLAGQSIFALTAHSTSPRATKIYTGILIYGLIAVGTGIYLVTNQALIHQIIFGLFTAAIVAISWRICQCTAAANVDTMSERALSMGRCMMHAFYYNLGAFCLWLVDNTECGCGMLRELRSRWGHPWTALLQLHAWWHILTALGLCWFIGGLLLSDPFYGPGYRVRRQFLCLPIISLVDRSRWLSVSPNPKERHQRSIQ